jgi:hypothetical protein
VEVLQDEKPDGGSDQDGYPEHHVFADIDSLGLERELSIALFAHMGMTKLHVDKLGHSGAMGTGLAEKHDPELPRAVIVRPSKIGLLNYSSKSNGITIYGAIFLVTESIP